MPIASEQDRAEAIVVHLEPALRAEVQKYSAKAGISMESFIHTASAALIQRRKEEEWYAKPRNSTPEGRARAIEILSRAGNNPPMPGDELPEGYVPS
jgi:hypothetical protein